MIRSLLSRATFGLLTLSLGLTAALGAEPVGLRPDGASYRVLVVDDSMFVAKQLTQIPRR